MTALDTAALALLREAADLIREVKIVSADGYIISGAQAEDLSRFLKKAAALSSASSQDGATPQPAEPAAKPDGVTVDDAMIKRAAIALCDRNLLGPSWQDYRDDAKAALKAALTPAPCTEGPIS